MKTVKYPLYIQTLAMLIAYLSVFVLISLICFDMKFGFGWEAILRSPIGDRIDVVSDAVNIQLNSNDPKDWNKVLASFESQYGANFYLFDPFGTQLAGKPVALPSPVRSRIDLFPRPLAALVAAQKSPQGTGSKLPLFKPNFFPSAPFSQEHRFDFLPLPPPRDLAGLNFRLGNGGTPSRGMLPHLKSITRSDGRLWISVDMPVFSQSTHFPMPVALIVCIANFWRSPLLFDFGFLGTTIVIVVVFSLMFWWPFVYSITSRVSVLTTATQKIASGDFEARTNAKHKDELGHLAEGINVMADRLSDYLLAQKRVVGDISHELVTPLARLDMAVELLNTASAEEREGLIADIKEEIQDMHHLVDEILAFTKAELRGKRADLGAVRLHSLVEEVLEKNQGNERITVDIGKDLKVLADPLLLRRALSNIIRNSLRYAGDIAKIEINAEVIDENVWLTVLDTGREYRKMQLRTWASPFFVPISHEAASLVASDLVWRL